MYPFNFRADVLISYTSKYVSIWREAPKVSKRSFEGVVNPMQLLSLLEKIETDTHGNKRKEQAATSFWNERPLEDNYIMTFNSSQKD